MTICAWVYLWAFYPVPLIYISVFVAVPYCLDDCSFAGTWMDLEIVILSEVSQKEKDKYHTVSPVCGIKKNGTNELIYKTEIESQM